MGAAENYRESHRELAHCNWGYMGNTQRVLIKAIDAIPEICWRWMTTVSVIAWSVAAMGLPILFVMAAWNRTAPVESVVISATDAVVTGATIVSIDIEPDDRSCSRATYRWLTDSKGVDHFVSSDSMTAAARTKFFKSLRVGVDIIQVVPMPKGIATGPATYHSESEYGCNPIQSYWWPIVATWSAPFTIIP